MSCRVILPESQRSTQSAACSLNQKRDAGKPYPLTSAPTLKRECLCNLKRGVAGRTREDTALTRLAVVGPAGEQDVATHAPVGAP